MMTEAETVTMKVRLTTSGRWHSGMRIAARVSVA